MGAVPVFAGEGDRHELFPVYGITLGKTTVAEVADVQEDQPEDGADSCGSITIEAARFDYEKGVFTTLELEKTAAMPPVWENAGFRWNLSYQAWLDLFNQQGFIIKLIQPPTLQITGDHLSLEAEFEAFRESELPTVFTFTFTENRGNGATAENALAKIKARYVPEFKEITAETGLESLEQVSFDEQQRKALGLSGIIAEINGLYHEKLELVPIDKTATEYWKKVLAEKWLINNRKQLLEKLSALESAGDSQVYRGLAAILNDHQGLTVNEIGVKLNDTGLLAKRLCFVKEKGAVIGDRGLRAWDYSRMALLCRIGYQVGFLTANQAWEYLCRILSEVEGRYHSWEDYAANVILGMIFNAIESGRETETANQALWAYARLINREGSAWRLAWNRKKTEPALVNSINDVPYFPPREYYAWIHYLNGRQSYQKGEYQEAIKYFERALSLDQEFSRLWFLIGISFLSQSNHEKAIEALNEYLKRVPDDYLSLIYLAEAYEKNNLLNEAFRTYNQAIDRDDSRPEGFIGLGRVALNSGDYEAAITYLRIAESLTAIGDGNIAYTLYLLGYSYYKEQKFDKALSYFLRVYGNYQDDQYLNYYLGICYLYNQNLKMAATYFSRAEELGMTIPQEVKDLLEKPGVLKEEDDDA
ncbi:MAG: tetratricopeptide repeat protein [Firmicutes bacterium]|nr:tetratricopeptide repeat protein [Bacillota bacterium]